MLKAYKKQISQHFRLDSESLIEDPQERRKRFLLEFENPFKCDKCGERFRRKKHLQEHKEEIHSY
jgi:uncharacterized Zn-finger protein